ncbi:TetR/AcrR family transcriptional regulator [Methylotuvimicrobium sp. KM1]|uniref:TetR/AcrR family transcriptional regulator n=1 Tax=Methylotuvimicrobium sp. KM1 TaxID=3377707 RepID=UPI00384F2374
MTMDKREIIVEAAYKLFKSNGFFATGVDLIMREAGVSKRTMYKYFPTKNELIVAVLAYYRTSYQRHIDDLLSDETQSPREKIKVIFDDAAAWFGDINFHGCLAVNAMSEFAGKDKAVEEACLQFKQWERSVIEQLCISLGARQPRILAYKLFVLLEGMSSIALIDKSKAFVNITPVAEQLIDAHTAASCANMT